MEKIENQRLKRQKEIVMHSEFVSLAVIAFISAIIPMVAKSIPRRLVPETVLLLLAGSLLGPHGFHIMQIPFICCQK